MCDCVAKVNEQLAQFNTTLDSAIVVSMSQPGSRSSLLIQTSRLSTRTPAEKRSKVKKVMPSFCPFCGTKISRELSDNVS